MPKVRYQAVSKQAFHHVSAPHHACLMIAVRNGGDPRVFEYFLEIPTDLLEIPRGFLEIPTDFLEIPKDFLEVPRDFCRFPRDS